MMGAQMPDMPCGRWPDIDPVRCVWKPYHPIL